jgi:hypothetical protein
MNSELRSAKAASIPCFSSYNHYQEDEVMQSLQYLNWLT